MKKLFSSALGLAFLLVSGWASAVMVDSFDYTLNGGWLEGTEQCNGANDCVTFGGDMTTLDAGDVYSNITWGTDIGNGLSSLTSWQNDAAAPGGIDLNPAGGDTTGSGTVLTDGSVRVGTVFEHDNNTVLNDDNLLTQISFAEEFTITGTSPAITGPIDPMVTALIFGVAFFETPNVSGGCPDAQTSGTPCDDFFVLLNEELLTPEVEVCDDGECWTYVFTIATDGLTTVNTADLGDFGITLDAAQLAMAGDTVGVLVTEEGQLNQFVFGFSATHVPEPQTLALMGLGLLGLGLSRRRRRAA